MCQDKAQANLILILNVMPFLPLASSSTTMIHFVRLELVIVFKTPECCHRVMRPLMLGQPINDNECSEE